MGKLIRDFILYVWIILKAMFLSTFMTIKFYEKKEDGLNVHLRYSYGNRWWSPVFWAIFIFSFVFIFFLEGIRGVIDFLAGTFGSNDGNYTTHNFTWREEGIPQWKKNWFIFLTVYGS